MKPFTKLISLLYPYTQRLGVCGNTGLIAGVITGLILGILNLRIGPGLVLTNTEAWQLAGILALFSWIVIVFLLLLVLRVKLSQVIIPVLINTLLVCSLTVFTVNTFHLFPIAWLIGMLIGIIIGYLLCQLSKLLKLKR